MEISTSVDTTESDFILAPLPKAAAERVPRDVTKHLVKGSSALGLAIVIERGMGFLANILAARFGGAATFGTYSLAITQANNISTYAGGGIGSTAVRFSGKYPRGGRGYAALSRVLIIVSTVSALIAAFGLWLGAAPLAHLLHKASLVDLLRWTAISAAGIILLECARGFFLGQARLAALVLLSMIVGAGMLVLIPFAAGMHKPVHMIVLQGAITTTAVIVCLSLARPLGLLVPKSPETALPLLPILREVWVFGFVQLAGLIGMNLAGWWLVTLVARADTSLVQMSFFAIASQLRNIASLAPSMLTESSYAVMADPEGGKSNTPQHVMALCTYASTVAALTLASLGIILAPWALQLVYGAGYRSAAITVVIALSVAVIHMGNAPAAARLSIVSIRSLAIINTVWAVFVALSATVFLLHAGSAWRAMMIYLAGHILSSALVLLVLSRKDQLPTGMLGIFLFGSATGLGLAFLAWLRIQQPWLAVPTTGLMILLSLTTLTILFFSGRRHHWLPTSGSWGRLFGSLQRSLQLIKRYLHVGVSHGA